MNSIAIIPARSGSKGLKDKNIRLLDGKPMIAYTIEAALQSNMFDTVLVSTDSEQYARIAQSYGAEVPFIRSATLSNDFASSWDVVKDVIRRMRGRGNEYEVLALLQPTSPLRSSFNIQKAFNIFTEKQANAVVSVCEVDHSPLWANILPSDGSMDNFLPKYLFETPRQQLDTYYRINGAIYLVKTEYLLQTDSIYEQKCYAYIMDKRYSLDIDDELDFNIGETLIKSQPLYESNKKDS